MSLRLLRESIRAILREEGPHAAQHTGAMSRPDTAYDEAAKKIWSILEDPDFLKLSSDSTERMLGLLGIEVWNAQPAEIKKKVQSKVSKWEDVAEILQSKSAQLEYDGGQNAVKAWQDKIKSAIIYPVDGLATIRKEREKFGEGGLPGYIARMFQLLASMPNALKVYENSHGSFDRYVGHSWYDLPKDEPERSDTFKRWFSDPEEIRRNIFNNLGGVESGYTYNQFKKDADQLAERIKKLAHDNEVLETLDPILDGLAQRIFVQVDKFGANEVLENQDYAYHFFRQNTPKGSKSWNDLTPDERQVVLHDPEKIKAWLRSHVEKHYDGVTRALEELQRQVKNFESSMRNVSSKMEDFESSGDLAKVKKYVETLFAMSQSEEYFFDAVLKSTHRVKRRLEDQDGSFTKLDQPALKKIFDPEKLLMKLSMAIILEMFSPTSVADWIDSLKSDIERVKLMYKKVPPEAPADAPFEKYIFAQQRDDVPPEPNTPEEQEVKKKLDQHYSHDQLLDEPTGKMLNTLAKKGQYEDVLAPPSRFKLAFRGLSMTREELEKFLKAEPKSSGVVKKRLVYKPIAGSASWSVEKNIAQDFARKGGKEYKVVLVARIPTNMFIMNPDETRHISVFDGYADEREVIGVGDVKVFALEYTKSGTPGAGLKTPKAPTVKFKKKLDFAPKKKPVAKKLAKKKPISKGKKKL